MTSASVTLHLQPLCLITHKKNAQNKVPEEHIVSTTFFLVGGGGGTSENFRLRTSNELDPTRSNVL